MPPATRPTPFPRYVFGPKPKRRTELGLLLFGSLLIVALYVIAALGQKSKIPDNIGAFLGIVLGLALVAHMANRWLAPNANAVILPLAALLNGIGYVVIARWDPGQAQGQAAWAALGIVLYVLTLLVVRYSRDLERYRYLLLLVAGIFLVAPLFFSPIYGARLWVHFGSLEFQPIEFSKILLCIFFASYFAENKEMLTIPTAQVGNRLYLDPRPLIPILVAWGAAMAVIGLEDDIGFAALLFVLFIGLSGWPRVASATWCSGWCSSAWAPISRHDTSARCTCGWSSGRTRGPRRRNRATASWRKRGTAWGPAVSAGPDWASTTTRATSPS